MKFHKIVKSASKIRFKLFFGIVGFRFLEMFTG